METPAATKAEALRIWCNAICQTGPRSVTVELKTRGPEDPAPGASLFLKWDNAELDIFVWEIGHVEMNFVPKLDSSTPVEVVYCFLPDMTEAMEFIDAFVRARLD